MYDTKTRSQQETKFVLMVANVVIYAITQLLLISKKTPHFIKTYGKKMKILTAIAIVRNADYLWNTQRLL